jgi:RimJ/RimL family protein N-acetyltransferase
LPPFRRRGFAREAVVALMRWAHRTHGVDTFVASIAPDNVPSLALARSLGFEQIGSHMDEVDGLELILALPATALQADPENDDRAECHSVPHREKRGSDA